MSDQAQLEFRLHWGIDVGRRCSIIVSESAPEAVTLVGAAVAVQRGAGQSPTTSQITGGPREGGGLDPPPLVPGTN